MVWLAIIVGLTGGYLLSSYKRKLFKKASFVIDKINGTYRSPDMYLITWESDDKTVTKQWDVKSLYEIPEPYRTIIRDKMLLKHEWLDRFLFGDVSLTIGEMTELCMRENPTHAPSRFAKKRHFTQGGGPH